MWKARKYVAADAKMNHAAVKLLMANSMGELVTFNLTVFTCKKVLTLLLAKMFDCSGVITTHWGTLKASVRRTLLTTVSFSFFIRSNWAPFALCFVYQTIEIEWEMKGRIIHPDHTSDFVFACTASPNLATIEGIPLPAAEKLGDEFRVRNII